jgi:ribosomal protein S18 acetylase RimI-like enzyme
MRSPRTPRVRTRLFTPEDADAVGVVFAGLSTASRHARFLGPIDRLTPSMHRALTAVGQQHVALIAEVRVGRSWNPIGLARYVLDGPGRAEIAYEVVDAWQGRGIGSRLLRELVDTARRSGVEQLHASVLPDNQASLALLRRVLPQLRVRTEDGVLEVTAWLIEQPLALSDLLVDLEVA